MDIRLNIGSWIASFFNWLDDNVAWFFDALKSFFVTLYDAVFWLFSTPSGFIVVIVVAIAALFARGWKFAVGVVIGLTFIMSVNQWDHAMETISLVLVAAFLAVLLAIPLGIWAAKNDTVSKVLKPILDFLQTLPAFVYLVPALAFFSVGVAPGIISTIIFAMAPGVRLTELGIRGVDSEVVEAGQAFGASPRRILRQIQLPLAMPSIMAGINQIIMLSLSMVVIAGLVGAGGLGGEVAKALGKLDVGLGFEAGLSVVAIAIILDRFTGAFGKGMGLYSTLANRRAQAKAADEQARLDAQEIIDKGVRYPVGMAN
ncbi:ABC transporter permease [Demequina oxidasica]|uniref:ABC transporter permease n=1 Tax=Demequina oxidasica TaxID=676199 RepID=UPI000A043A44|nr:ABC transporter permease subunit [Demequina oxidasica]